MKFFIIPDQLLNLALVAGPQEQIDAARYFSSSERRQLPKAVMLYHKAGLLSKAVDLAFKSGQISAVGQIAGDLDETADPALIQRCAQYFISNGQYDRAVSLLITGRQVNTTAALVYVGLNLFRYKVILFHYKCFSKDAAKP